MTGGKHQSQEVFITGINVTNYKPAFFNAFIYLLFFYSLSFVTLTNVMFLLAGGFFCSLLGNSILLHRYYTHKQFRLSKVVEYFLLPFALILGIGSPIMYATMHTQHHRLCDTPFDPHSPSQLGLSTVMLGFWEFFTEAYFRNLNAPLPKRLLVQPLQIFIHKNYYTIWIAAFSITALFNFKLAIMIFGWIPVYQKVFENTIVNGLCHLKKDIILDWPIFGIITAGESMQRYHHKYPSDYTHSKNWLVDPAAPIIEVIKK